MPPHVKSTVLASLCLAVLLAASRGQGAELRIDAAFPGGNIIVDRIVGDAVFLRQELRDTNGDWFYWAFQVQGAAGRTLAFTFATDKYGARGPAISTDGGATWRWLGRDTVKDRTFRHTFAGEGEVRFSMGMPYTEANLNAFLQLHATHPALRTETLCRTSKGRSVELLSFGRVDGEARLRVFITARHHACEMMANYALEGIIQATLEDDTTGSWFRENVELRAVPFMDKDGVEEGDQGKNRRPHDHNRDYAGEPLYASVAAVKQMVPVWSGGRLKIALDLHCPGLRGRGHEAAQFIGGPESDFWQRVIRLSALLEDRSAPGPLRFRASDNLPFGQAWNVAERGLARSFASWARTIPGLRIGTTLELPYATSNGQEVNADTARAFGRVLVAALQAYLREDGD
jgi:hypothetical protein